MDTESCIIEMVMSIKVNGIAICIMLNTYVSRRKGQQNGFGTYIYSKDQKKYVGKYRIYGIALRC